MVRLNGKKENMTEKRSLLSSMNQMNEEFKPGENGESSILR